VNIKGIEGMTVGQVQDEVRRGAKFVIFSYAMSFLIITLKRSSDVHFIRAGQGTFGASLRARCAALSVGGGGCPWGPFEPPLAVFRNLVGGTDVPGAIMEQFGPPAPPPQGLPEVQVK